LRILVFGDALGVLPLLKHIPECNIVGIVGAVIRPQYYDELRTIANNHSLPSLIQPRPHDSGYAEFIAAVRVLDPDLIWVNSYSMILHEDLLSIPKLGGINIHGALLPQYRGSNPTQWAILNNESGTGVTMHEMVVGIDEGAVIGQKKVPLFFEDTWKDVYDRIAIATDELIEEKMPEILSGKWSAVPQDESKSKKYSRRKPEDGFFSWDEPVVDIYNKIRALLPPLPTAFYLDQSADKVHIDRQLTPFSVASLKYGFMMRGGVEAKRVCLRPLCREDSVLLYDWINCRSLVVFNAPFYPVSEVDHSAWMESMLTKRMDLVIFVIEELAEGHVIGTCQLFNINWQQRSAELQIRIGNETYQNKGFGTEGVMLLCEFGFTDLNLHRIYLNVFANNTRAIKAYEKCGFMREGLLKEAAYIDGVWIDVVVMAKLEAAIE
jgi:methionyl-tRNA formyltransferase/RimJ/RimL family protein N-acetyltransferase